MRLLIGAQFYPPIVGVRSDTSATWPTAYTQWATRSTSSRCAGRDDVGVDVEGGVRVIRVASAATRLPGLYSDRGARTQPCRGPGNRPRGRFAHRRAPLRRRACPQLDRELAPAGEPSARDAGRAHLARLQHVCAVKRMMRDGSPCPGPSLGACLRCAGALRVATGRPSRSATTRHAGEVAGVSRFLAVSSRWHAGTAFSAGLSAAT